MKNTIKKGLISVFAALFFSIGVTSCGILGGDTPGISSSIIKPSFPVSTVKPSTNSGSEIGSSASSSSTNNEVNE
jgi:hypothetical protein